MLPNISDSAAEACAVDLLINLFLSNRIQPESVGHRSKTNLKKSGSPKGGPKKVNPRKYVERVRTRANQQLVEILTGKKRLEDADEGTRMRFQKLVGDRQTGSNGQVGINIKGSRSNMRHIRHEGG